LQRLRNAFERYDQILLLLLRQSIVSFAIGAIQVQLQPNRPISFFLLRD